MALQAVIEEEVDARLGWARILGTQGRTISERPGLSPFDRYKAEQMALPGPSPQRHLISCTQRFQEFVNHPTKSSEAGRTLYLSLLTDRQFQPLQLQIPCTLSAGLQTVVSWI